jgi:NAD(P)-dependent dehydrogenase (short-subunit alcohol dehydrogenase family)
VEIAPFDVLDQRAVKNFLARLAQQSGRLDVLVNNAHSGRAGTLESAEAKEYADAFAVAVQAAAELTKAGIELLKTAAVRQGYASVINIASMYGMVSPDPSIYGDSGHEIHPTTAPPRLD